MKKKLLAGLSLVLLFSCTRTYSPGQPSTSINGNWRLTLVIDKISGQQMSKPGSITGDVDITFSTSTATTGIFFGNTPSNQIYQNPFTTAQNYSLAIEELIMTKVQETSWGSAFVENILDAQKYRIDANGQMHITTAAKELIFVKR